MKIQVIYNFDDLYEAQKLNYFSSKYKYLFYLIGTIFILMSLGVILAGVAIVQNLIGLASGLFFLTYPYTILRYYARATFKKQPSFNHPITFEIGENGIVVNTINTNGTNKWQAFTSLRNNEKILLLYMGTRLFNLIPRRAMSDEDWRLLLEIAKSKIPNHA